MTVRFCTYAVCRQATEENLPPLRFRKFSVFLFVYRQKGVNFVESFLIKTYTNFNDYIIRIGCSGLGDFGDYVLFLTDSTTNRRP